MKKMIDSNIIVYAFNKASFFYFKARRFLEDNFRRREEIFLSYQNLNEVFATLTKGVEKPFSQAEALGIIEYFFNHPVIRVIYPSSQTMTILFKLLKKYPNIKGQRIFDLFLVALMIENNIKTIYTKNIKDFAGINEIKAVNPL